MLDSGFYGEELREHREGKTYRGVLDRTFSLYDNLALLCGCV